MDESLIKDIIMEFEDAYEDIVNNINSLKILPGRKEYINVIIRKLHTMKGNFQMGGWNDLGNMIHKLETLMQQIRDQSITYHELFGSFIRLVLEEIKEMFSKYISSGKMPHELVFISNALDQVINPQPQERLEAIRLILKMLDPFHEVDYSSLTAQAPEEQVQTNSPQNLNPHTKISETPIQKSNPASSSILRTSESHLVRGIDLELDLRFFQEISLAVEHRLNSHPGKTQFILEIAMDINHRAGSKVPNDQLKAAVFLHDWGLSQLPTALLEKKEKLSPEETEKIRAHTQIAYEFLSKFPHWHKAAMILLQEQERPDGTGYPKGLKDDDICDGSKILSIVRAFEEIVHNRPYKQLSSRTVIAAIMKINQQSGLQFNEFWVDVFNNSIKALYSS
ncbi:MAG: HD domain-containing phosphohydrolase [Gammaproteobacteria bacterium]